ncbi:hypothetical protein ADUPG1_012207, partial [Aduncisulcus paluster]
MSSDYNISILSTNNEELCKITSLSADSTCEALFDEVTKALGYELGEIILVHRGKILEYSKKTLDECGLSSHRIIYFLRKLSSSAGSSSASVASDTSSRTQQRPARQSALYDDAMFDHPPPPHSVDFSAFGFPTGEGMRGFPAAFSISTQSGLDGATSVFDQLSQVFSQLGRVDQRTHRHRDRAERAERRRRRREERAERHRREQEKLDKEEDEDKHKDGEKDGEKPSTISEDASKPSD